MTEPFDWREVYAQGLAEYEARQKRAEELNEFFDKVMPNDHKPMDN